MVSSHLGFQVEWCQPTQFGISLNIGKKVQMDVVLAVQQGIEFAALFECDVGDGVDGHSGLFLQTNAALQTRSEFPFALQPWFFDVGLAIETNVKGQFTRPAAADDSVSVALDGRTELEIVKAGFRISGRYVVDHVEVAGIGSL